MSETCLICMETLLDENSEVNCKGGCKYNVHKDCMVKWLKAAEGECAICRKRLDDDNFPYDNFPYSQPSRGGIRLGEMDFDPISVSTTRSNSSRSYLNPTSIDLLRENSDMINSSRPYLNPTSIELLYSQLEREDDRDNVITVSLNLEDVESPRSNTDSNMSILHLVELLRLRR